MLIASLMKPCHWPCHPIKHQRFVTVSRVILMLCWQWPQMPILPSSSWCPSSKGVPWTSFTGCTVYVRLQPATAPLWGSWGGHYCLKSWYSSLCMRLKSRNHQCPEFIEMAANPKSAYKPHPRDPQSSILLQSFGRTAVLASRLSLRGSLGECLPYPLHGIGA